MRARASFREVRVGFWKEEPSLARCLDGVEEGEVIIVPLFMSGGYFTQEIIPRELRLEGAVTRRGGAVLRYTPPVGGHRALADLISERAQEAGAGRGTTLVVLGHGTPRNANSEVNIRQQAERVARKGAYAHVLTLFLDQAPRMTQVWDLAPTDHIVVTPLFMSDGWHVDDTIPGELGLEGERLQKAGRTLVYTPAVGTHPRMAEVIDELVREAVMGCGESAHE